MSEIPFFLVGSTWFFIFMEFHISPTEIETSGSIHPSHPYSNSCIHRFAIEQNPRAQKLVPQPSLVIGAVIGGGFEEGFPPPSRGILSFSSWFDQSTPRSADRRRSNLIIQFWRHSGATRKLAGMKRRFNAPKIRIIFLLPQNFLRFFFDFLCGSGTRPRGPEGVNVWHGCGRVPPKSSSQPISRLNWTGLGQQFFRSIFWKILGA